MTRTPSITVVVPAYNCASVLPHSLDSILAQTLGDFELVAIDDGSTDNTNSVLAAYAARDPRIRLHANPENLGLFEARRIGFSLAQGAYITTCDADDRMPPNALKSLYQTAKDKNVDIVHGRSRELHADGTGPLLRVADPFVAATGKEFVKAFLRNFRGWSVWGKMYRREVWNTAADHVPHGERIFLGEDLLFSFFIGIHSNTYAESREIVYHYRPGDAAGYFANPETAYSRMTDLFRVVRYIQSFVENNKPAQADVSPLVTALIHHFGSGIMRNLPPCPVLRALVAESIQLVRPPTTSQNLFRFPALLYQYIRENGWREARIVLHRFLSASGKRGIVTVLREVGDRNS